MKRLHQVSSICWRTPPSNLSPRLVWAEGRLAKRRVRGKSCAEPRVGMLHAHGPMRLNSWLWSIQNRRRRTMQGTSPAHDARDILEDRGVLMGKTLVAVAEDPPEASRVKGFYISCHSFTGNTSCPQALRFESRRPSATRFKPTPAAG